MKKNYLMMMAMLLFAAISFTGCSDDDDDNISGDAETLLVGTWEMTHETGYEVEDGETYSWDESYDNSGYFLTFYEDGTVDDDGYKGTWRVSGSKLLITDPYDGVDDVYTIRTLNETTLVLYYTESEDDYYGEDTLTFARR